MKTPENEIADRILKNILEHGDFSELNSENLGFQTSNPNSTPLGVQIARAGKLKQINPEFLTEENLLEMEESTNTSMAIIAIQSDSIHDISDEKWTEEILYNEHVISAAITAENINNIPNINSEIISSTLDHIEFPHEDFMDVFVDAIIRDTQHKIPAVEWTPEVFRNPNVAIAAIRSGKTDIIPNLTQEQITRAQTLDDGKTFTQLRMKPEVYDFLKLQEQNRGNPLEKETINHIIEFMEEKPIFDYLKQIAKQKNYTLEQQHKEMRINTQKGIKIKLETQIER